MKAFILLLAIALPGSLVTRVGRRAASGRHEVFLGCPVTLFRFADSSCDPFGDELVRQNDAAFRHSFHNADKKYLSIGKGHRVIEAYVGDPIVDVATIVNLFGHPKRVVVAASA